MESQSRQDFLNRRFGAQHRLYRKVNTRLLASGVHLRCSRGCAVIISVSLLIITAVRSSNRVLMKESRFPSAPSWYFRRRRGQEVLHSEVIYKVGYTGVLLSS